MEYTTKHIDPLKVLKKLGFNACRSSPGYEKVDTFDDNGQPVDRIHAILVDDRISVHFDRGNKEKRKHQASNSDRIKVLVEAIKAVDEMYEPTLVRRIKWRLGLGKLKPELLKSQVVPSRI